MKYPQLVSMPSAVSDWLEEQLEARGIDAVVYTRYVLSLLYRDPIDVICPDQDLHFTQPDKVIYIFYFNNIVLVDFELHSYNKTTIIRY